MKQLSDAVAETLDKSLFHWQANGTARDKCVQNMRQPVVDMCVPTGNNVSIRQVDEAILCRRWFLNKDRVDISVDEGFMTPDPIYVDSPITGLLVSQQWGAEVPPLVLDGVRALQVPRINHPWLRDVAEEARELLPAKEAEKFLAGYLFKELDRVGDSVHYLKRDKVEAAGRVHGMEGCNKVIRAISCAAQSRKMTKKGMAIHRQYVRDLGVNQAIADRILENPAQWVADQKKPASAMLIVSSVYSLYLAETTQCSPFGIRRDVSASGYSIQLWLLRFTELFQRIVTNSSKFVPAHNTMITAMQDSGWAKGTPNWSAFANCAPQLLMAIAKAAFMVCMYTGKDKAVFEGLTDEDRHHDPTEVVRYVLPQVLEDHYFGDLCNVEIYSDLCKLCVDLVKLFRDNFPHSQKFERHWSKKWESAKPAKVKDKQPYFSGYRVPYPLGGEVLIPYLGQSKKHRVTRSVDWTEVIDGKAFPRSIGATVYKEKWNDYSAVLVTAICRMYDSAMLYEGAVRNLHNSPYADHGMILDSTHDEIEFHPNDEDKVQENMTQGANKVFEFDLMETGREPLTLRKGSVIFR